MESGGIYDSGFEAYRTVTPDEYRSVLQAGLVILDTNVLLHLYRYHSGTRRDLMEILAAIKDHIWIPHQAMEEFWKRRSEVIDGRSKEIEETISGLQENGLRLGDGIRRWANRIGLPEKEKKKILDSVESAIKYTTSRIRALSDADATEVTRDTDSDPVLAALEPILDGRVGRPLTPDDAREAKKEALQRIADKRAPGWRDANKKENKEGDYFVWYQSLQEAKRRSLDVLFVTDDAKPDWWRIEHGETKGPLPELVYEMHREANVRLFMTRPETLLLHADDVIGKKVSSDSIRDVQRVSSQVDIQWNSESARVRYMQYENQVASAIAGLGYEVTYNDRVLPGDSVPRFDLEIRKPGDSRPVFGEIKLHRKAIPSSVIYELIGMSDRSSLPVLLISAVELTRQAQRIVEESENLVAAQWRGENDTPQLAAALEQLFVSEGSLE